MPPKEKPDKSKRSGKELRASDPPKSNAQIDDKTDALNEEIKRMRAQRLRLDRSQRTTRDRS